MQQRLSSKLIYIPVNVLFLSWDFSNSSIEQSTNNKGDPQHTFYVVRSLEKIALIVYLWEQSDIKTFTNGQLKK